MNIYTRREVLEIIAKAGAGAAVFSGMGAFIPELSANSKAFKEAMFYKKLPGGKVQCTLCPRMLTISEGESCECHTRKNINGKLFATGYGSPCIINLEPVERGPLYHYLPETTTLSLGAAGCNMDCLYCQNYELAQASPGNVKSIELDPKRAFREAKIKSVTLTYTDAACQPEYLIDLSKTAKKAGLPLILCTGGYINQEPLKEIIKYVDAFAITLKAYSENGYNQLTGVSLKPVLRTIKTVSDSGKHLEVVTLIVPGYNDERKGIQKIAGWINKSLGSETPWHLSRFTPYYKLNKVPATPRKTLEEAREIGMDSGLKYVYITNLAPHEGNHTYCPGCGKKVIERLGFKARKMSLKNGKCPYCGAEIKGHWS